MLLLSITAIAMPCFLTIVVPCFLTIVVPCFSLYAVVNGVTINMHLLFKLLLSLPLLPPFPPSLLPFLPSLPFLLPLSPSLIPSPTSLPPSHPQTYGFPRLYRRLIEYNRRCIADRSRRRAIQDKVKYFFRIPNKIGRSLGIW